MALDIQDKHPGHQIGIGTVSHRMISTAAEGESPTAFKFRSCSPKAPRIAPVRVGDEQQKEEKQQSFVSHNGMRLPSSSDNMSINVQIYTLDERIPNFSHVFYAPFLHVHFVLLHLLMSTADDNRSCTFWHHCCSLDHTTSKTSLSTSHKFIHQHNTLTLSWQTKKNRVSSSKSSSLPKSPTALTAIWPSSTTARRSSYSTSSPLFPVCPRLA